MKKLIQKIVFFILLPSCFVIQNIFAQEGKPGEGIEEPKQIEKIAEKKLKMAEEAKERALEAEKNEKAAMSEMEKYKIEAADISLSTQKREQALSKQQEWNSKAQEYAKTKEAEIENENKFTLEAKALSQKQNELAKEFIPTQESSKKDIVKEKFEKCIKQNILTSFQAEKTQLTSSKMQEYLDRLSQKLGELAFYERINFYKSNEMTTEQWQGVHKQALADPTKYDAEYVTLLKNIQQLKLLIGELVKQKNIKIPTTKENNECLIKIYKTFDAQLKQLEQIAAEDSLSWNN